MIALAIFGWVVLLLFGLWLTGCSLFAQYINYGFCGRSEPFLWIVAAFGLAVLGAAFWIAPFHMVLK